MSASRKHTVLPSWTPPGLVVPVDQSSTRPLVLRPVLQLCCLSRFSPSLCLSPSLLSHVSLGCGLRRRNHLPRQTRLALRKLKCAVRHRPGMSLSLKMPHLSRLFCPEQRWNVSPGGSGHFNFPCLLLVARAGDRT